MAAPNPNPFDFSDFGGQAPPATSSPHIGPRSSALGDGFDPFAGESMAGQQTPSADEVFAAPATVSGSSALVVAGPPLLLIAAALIAAALGVVLGLVAAGAGSSIALAFAGWLLAGPGAIGVLAWFIHVDTRRRLESVYSAPSWLSTAYWVVIATCAAGIGVGAWHIALWAGRQ